MAAPLYLKDVVTLDLCVAKCSGCRMCTTVCPHGVFRLEQKKAKIVNRDGCMECGACAQNCASAAISVSAVGCGCASLFIRRSRHGPIARCFFRLWGYNV
ncbi:MAG: 4Fe-4S dicluster domain-containing protein [Kiritimatiellaeota bacterium]|nr:4Fe-4S dicluster domain-containing protein [Kiritimatiellota bacterium]